MWAEVSPKKGAPQGFNEKGVFTMAKVTSNTTNQMCVGEGVGFERIRRITGYLVGTTDRFNNAKRAEESERVKHGITAD